MKRSLRRTMPALLLAGLLLTACTQLQTILSGGTELPPEVDPTKVMCEAMRPITYSSRDTVETRCEVIKNNAAWCAVCRDREPRCEAALAQRCPTDEPPLPPVAP